MATVQSVFTTQALQGATASGGIAGAPVMVRSTAAAGKIQIGIDYYTTLGTEATGTVIEWWPQIPATARLALAFLQWGNLGSGAQLSLGKVDPNNAANTNATEYLPATAAATSGNAIAMGVNQGEQVGQDPLGDQSTGNTAPGFGALPIIITSTLTGATAAASIQINVVFFFVSGS